MPPELVKVGGDRASEQGGEVMGEDPGDLDMPLDRLAVVTCRLAEDTCGGEVLLLYAASLSRNLCVIWCCFILPYTERIIKSRMNYLEFRT